MCEAFGIRMISVAMLEEGPDIEAIKQLVANDASIKGMWCVPKYSNPTGTVYADSIVETLASMPTAAKDFRLFWDNAYMLHPLGETDHALADIYAACSRNGHSNRPLVFASTSKMTLPGTGIAMLGCSAENTAWWLKSAALRSVGPDKINQLRQVRFLKNTHTMKALMEQHRLLLKPKFDRVHEVFNATLAEYGIARWSRPGGGYFVSLDVMPGIATRVVELAAKAGIRFASPGSCFPYGIDPHDAQLRIAPSFPDLDQLSLALEVIATCVMKATCGALEAANEEHRL
jgi:DNA-binding transcriptional MocR family regulator